MKYVVLARFDNKANEKLGSLREKLHNQSCLKEISEWPPHITIAAYEEIDILALLQWMQEFAEKHSAFDIQFASLGVFPPHKGTAVVYASPTQSKALFNFYYAFHEKFDDFCGDLGWLYSAKFGHPVFHSTIGAFKVKQLQKAMEIIFARQIPMTAQINALEVYTYPMALIQRFEL